MSYCEETKATSFTSNAGEATEAKVAEIISSFSADLYALYCETEAEKKMLYEYQWTYSPAPNVISYLITPQWPNKIEPDAIWEKIQDGKLYSATISDYQDDLKSKMQAKAKENEAQRKTLEQFVPEKVNEVVPEENYDALFDGEDLPSHEELQAEFNVDDD